MANSKSLIAAVWAFLLLAGCGSPKAPGVKAGAVADAPPKVISRTKVEATIRLFAKNLGERYRTDAKWAERFKADDPESVNEILRLACQENGITQEEYEWAIHEDKVLHELQTAQLAEVLDKTNEK